MDCTLFCTMRRKRRGIGEDTKQVLILTLTQPTLACTSLKLLLAIVMLYTIKCFHRGNLVSVLIRHNLVLLQNNTEMFNSDM